MPQHQSDKIANVIAVVRHMKARFNTPATTTQLRRFAVEEVAKGHSVLYKNLNSATKTIHDACARRFRPDIRNMEHFDTLVDDWRSRRSINANESSWKTKALLKGIIQKHAKESINKLFS